MPEEYEVQSICDIKKENNRYQVLIHWKGFDESERTWEPYRNVNSKGLIPLLVTMLKEKPERLKCVKEFVKAFGLKRENRKYLKSLEKYFNSLETKETSSHSNRNKFDHPSTEADSDLELQYRKTKQTRISNSHKPEIDFKESHNSEIEPEEKYDSLLLKQEIYNVSQKGFFKTITQLDSQNSIRGLNWISENRSEGLGVILNNKEEEMMVEIDSINEKFPRNVFEHLKTKICQFFTTRQLQKKCIENILLEF